MEANVHDTLAHLHDFLNQATGGQVKHHHKFSSALVKLPSGICIDVATARLEYYPSPAALPCVELSSLKMDLYRRDFTINAMVLACLSVPLKARAEVVVCVCVSWCVSWCACLQAIELTKGRLGTLVDYFGGINDLRQKVVRVLHSLR
jgi:tRNA nucleotidyltransferase (CCA-adding enzyme)